MPRSYLKMAVLLFVLFAMAVPAKAENVLRWSSKGDSVTFDPHSANMGSTYCIVRQTYENLAMFDPEMKLRPALAVSWKILNPTTWEFKLRKGVKFHDGRPFTSADVVFSIGRAQGPGSDIKKGVDTIKEVKAIDDYTVHVITKEPNPLLPEMLAMVYFMSKGWCEEHKSAQATSWAGKEESYAVRHANGTGPFILVSREPNMKTVWRKNPNWWGLKERPVDIDKMIYTPISNDSTRVAAMLSGELDFLLDPPLQDLPRLKRNKNIKVTSTSQLRTIFLGMDVSRDELRSSNIKGKNPFKDVRVRKAMYMAIDINGIHKKVMRNLSLPANIIVPPGINGYPADLDKARPAYDPEGAKKLLTEAGYPNGFEVTLDTPNNRYINDEKISQAVVGMLGKIGIKVNLSSQSKTLHMPKITKHNTDFYMLGWGYSYPDAHNCFMYLLDSKSNWNGGKISVPRVDALITGMAQEMDKTKRDAMIREVFEISVNQQLYLPLHHQVIVWAMNKKFDIPMEPRSRPLFSYGRFVK